MKHRLIYLLGLVMCPLLLRAEDTSAYERDVVLWYEAFSTKDPTLLERILSEDWVDIPAPPDQPSGPEGAKRLLVSLTTAFPDLKLDVKEVLHDGNKVIVRAEMAGTQRGPFLGCAPKGRRMSVQVIDIHEFKDGQIVRTWHTEDWLTGLHQLGAFEK